MRYLLISLCFLFVGCASYPKKNNFKNTEISAPEVLNPYFSDEAKDYVYKAQITVYDKHFGGIFIVKKIAANEYRVVFTTEMGNKIFDFSYINDDFNVNYILKELDKKLLINLLQKDFKVLIEERPVLLNSYISNEEEVFEVIIYNKKHYYFTSNNQLEKIVKISSGKEKTIFIFSEINGILANNIEVEHSKIKINLIYLRKL